ncbi:ParB N-terminal domain-containing protein [uncultured Friedmanniella sp.]|uniref:ParB N-terminal domain-containing protein n=1 Tax=uncultured Friedmanniella sp. TaxID=335381 RepID=UPI0035CA2B4C
MLEHLLQVEPGDLIIGANIRTATCTDSHADAKQFAASIKARGVLEAITCHRDPDNRLVVLRGQRRAIVAAQVGTPTVTVPVRVVDTPGEVDRITDQLGENVHREPMVDTDVFGAVEQLALLGVSATQITKQVAIPRSHVDAALTVTRAPHARGTTPARAVPAGRTPVRRVRSGPGRHRDAGARR